MRFSSRSVAAAREYQASSLWRADDGSNREEKILVSTAGFNTHHHRLIDCCFCGQTDAPIIAPIKVYGQGASEMKNRSQTVPDVAIPPAA